MDFNYTFQLRDILIATSVIISLFAFIFSIIDLKKVIYNYTKKKNLDKLSKKHLILLEEYIEEFKKYRNLPYDCTFIEDLKSIIEGYLDVHLESFIYSNEVNEKIKILNKIYNICVFPDGKNECMKYLNSLDTKLNELTEKIEEYNKIKKA